MSKPVYCIKCDEAVEIIDLVSEIRGSDQTKSLDNKMEWDYRAFAVCLNPVCPLLNTLITKVLSEKFYPKKSGKK